MGQVAAASPVNCVPGPTTMAQYLEGGAPSYVTPSAGVITSYSVRASAGAGLVRLVVFGPSATAGHRTVVAMSAQNAVAINTAVNTFTTRVPVTAGLSIGLNNSASSMICWGAGVAGDQVAAAPFDPAGSSDFPGGNPQNTKRVNISAVLEPDVDGDQYGDLTQDLCPQSKLTQAACPAPDTKVTKHAQEAVGQPQGQDQVLLDDRRLDVHLRGRRQGRQALHLAVQEEVQGRQAHRGHHRHERRRDRRPDAGDGEVQGDEAEALTLVRRSVRG